MHDLDALLTRIERQLLPGLRLESVDPDEPVLARDVPAGWELVGTGNYAAVLAHPEAPGLVVKVYAPGRPGLDEEADVYRRIGEHPSYAHCHHAGATYLVLDRLVGTNLYDCLRTGVRIEPSVIADIDAALDYARERGLHPHDVHPKNVMRSEEGRGIVVDVSDFGHDTYCPRWDDTKRLYQLVYAPVLLRVPVRIPDRLLELGRWVYRFLKRCRD